MEFKNFLTEKRFSLWQLLRYGVLLNITTFLIGELAKELRINILLAFLIYLSFLFNILMFLAYFEASKED